MEAKERTHYMDQVVEGLRKAAVELEELQVQATLGKAEANDKFEEVKKKFNLFVHETKATVTAGNEKVAVLQGKLEELRLQLTLGKADTLVAFQTQKKKILLALHDIEYKIKDNEVLGPIYTRLIVEIEKFKIELEMLEQRFDERKKAARDPKKSEEKRQEFKSFVDGITNRFKKKDETKWGHFQQEISEAFKHLKGAFVNS